MSAPLPDPKTPSPHQDPAQWDKLIECIGPASILVLIDCWIGRELRASTTSEDIWQEALCAAWRDRDQHSWSGPSQFRAWLLEIARNRTRDAARRFDSEKRGGQVEIYAMSSHSGSESGSGSGSWSSLLPPGSTTPSMIASHKETAEVMAKCLEALPPELEPPVRMYLFEELTMESIAKQLDIGISAAWYRFRKGSEIYGRCLERLTGRDSGAGAAAGKS